MLALAAAAAAATCAMAGRAQKPSFLILLADDVGAGDVGYGCILNSTVVRSIAATHGNLARVCACTWSCMPSQVASHLVVSSVSMVSQQRMLLCVRSKIAHTRALWSWPLSLDRSLHGTEDRAKRDVVSLTTFPANAPCMRTHRVNMLYSAPRHPRSTRSQTDQTHCFCVGSTQVQVGR